MNEHEAGTAEPLQAETVRITALSYGPHAIARRAGKVMFVRGAVPGEVVAITVREERRSYAYAEVTCVVEPSVDRRRPPCAYLPRCGGCPWQHIVYPAQLRAKDAIVREHLERAVDLSQTEWRPILTAPVEFGYRHRLSLRVTNREVGFFAGGTHELVPVGRCLLGEAALDDAIPVAAEWVGRLHSEVGRLEILLAQDGTRWVFAAEAQGIPAGRDDVAGTDFLGAHPRVAGLVLRARRVRRVWGDERCALEIEPGLTLVVRAGTFTQVSRAGNRLLVQAVMAAGGCHERRGRVLDLFAGAGNLSLPIARRGAAVVAVERTGLAVADGIANAHRLGITNCEFRAEPALAAVRGAVQRGERYEVALLDPPRSGAAEVLPALLTLAPARLVYVSCDPATLARDLRALAPRYQVEHVQPIDLFPQTYHVETVVALRRR